MTKFRLARLTNPTHNRQGCTNGEGRPANGSGCKSDGQVAEAVSSGTVSSGSSRRLNDGDIISLGATTSFEFRAG